MIHRLTILNLQLPRIVSEAPLIHFVPSLSSNEIKYRVDLTPYTCTCPDWTNLRAVFPSTDLRRACKHIATLMQFFPLGWLLPVPAEPFRQTYIFIDGYHYSLVVKQSNSWVDVRVKNRLGAIYEYGYDTADKRWAYSNSPKHSKILRPLILKWLMSNDHNDWIYEDEG